MATMLFKHWILKMYLMRGTHTLNIDFGFIAQKTCKGTEGPGCGLSV